MVRNEPYSRRNAIMSIIRNLMATGLVALTIAGATIATPALAHGDHGGGGHSGGFASGRGGDRFSGEGHAARGLADHGLAMGGDRHFGFAHRNDRRNRFFSDDDNDVFYDQYPACQLGWSRDRSGHLHRTEICS
jgi:hypothetical protein